MMILNKYFLISSHCPQKKGLSPINISLLKTWVLTLYRLEGYDSLTKGIDHNKHNIRQLLSLCP